MTKEGKDAEILQIINVARISPSFRELARATQMGATAIQARVKRLRKKGFLTGASRKCRTLKVKGYLIQCEVGGKQRTFVGQTIKTLKEKA